MNKNTIIGIVVLVVVIIGGYFLLSKPVSSEHIKIGVITDLTGPAAYWGESTREGALLAINEMKKDGANIEVLFEDYQLDASKAVSAAQKLVNFDNVDAIYAEFNPAAISVSSFLKGKNVLYVYDAAVTSPLEDLPYAFKTYLDYQAGCRVIAEKFKNEGINEIGFLKVNLEFGDLCLAGIKEIYGDSVISEGYNLGDNDLRTQMLKIKSKGAGAVINVGFEGDTYNTLKIIHDLKYKIFYGTVDDTITDKVKKDFSIELAGGHGFGFIKVDPIFSEKLNSFLEDRKLATEYAAALAYTHVRQMGKALIQCNKEISCVVEKLNEAKSDQTIGFEKFENRIGVFEMSVKDY